ncbi:MAG TPA: hypothetical protein VI029_14380, partial [Mycobacterium sp.]
SDIRRYYAPHEQYRRPASTTYEFDISSWGLKTTYAVFLESRGKRALLEGSTIAPNVAHVKSQVHRQLPATVSVVTDLGNASALLTLPQQ